MKIVSANITGSLILNGTDVSSITGSQSSIDSLNSKTGSYAVTGSNIFVGNQIVTGSLNINSGITGSLLGTSSFANNALSASYSNFSSNALSSSYAATSSFANDLTVAGTITAQKLNVQQVTSSVVYSSGSNVFGNSQSNIQVFTGSVYITGSVVGNTSTWAETIENSTNAIQINGISVNTHFGHAFDTTYIQHNNYLLNSNNTYDNISQGSAVITLNETAITFRTAGANTSPTTKMLLYNDGTVVIGSPGYTGYKLDVQGTGRFSGSLTGTSATFSSSVTASNGLFNGYTSGLPTSSGSAARGGLRLNNASNIAFDFGTVAAGQAWIQISDAGNYASNFPLLLNPNGGNVLIGTTTDSGYKLDVNGTGRFGGALTGTSATFTNNYLLNNSSASKKGYTYQSPASNWGPQLSGVYFTPSNATDAATTFSIDIWDGLGNIITPLSIAPTGAATFLSTVATTGIVFPATQVASSNPNTLDDYEEGTWTPTAIFSGGNGDLTYTVQIGRYVKIGKLVTCVGYLLFSENTASGNLQIGGLPFQAASIYPLLLRFGVGVDNLTGISGMPTGEILDSGVVIGMSYTGTGTASPINNTHTSGNAVFRMTFSYITN